MTGTERDDLAEFYRTQRQRDLDLYRVRRHFHETFGDWPPVDLSPSEVTNLHIERLEARR